MRENAMRTIIKAAPESNGAYANQEWPDDIPAPDGYIHLPDEFIQRFKDLKCFIVPAIENGRIIAISDNPDARAAQEAADAATTPPVEPITLLAETTVDHEYRISLLELGVTS